MAVSDVERADDFLATWFTPDDRIAAPTPEEVVPALAVEFAKVRRDERAAIVAYLRSLRTEVTAGRIAGYIERGEHGEPS